MTSDPFDYDDDDDLTAADIALQEERIREREEERDTCLFPGECCMPGEHTSDECHTAEMMQQWEEAEHNKSRRPRNG